MATLGFPSNPQIGDTYSVGSRTWIWTGQGWKIDSTQSSPSFNSLSVGQLFVTTGTNSTSTTTGGVVITGGVGIRQDVWVGGTIYSANSEVVTTATIGNLAGSLQAVTDRGNSTTNAIVITNATESTTATDGALVVTGGVGIGGNLNVTGDITARKLTIEFTTVTTTIVETDDIIVTNNLTNAVNTFSGALRVAGGAAVGNDLWVENTVYSNAIRIGNDCTTPSQFNNDVKIMATTSATDRYSGAFQVRGGAAIAGDLWVGGIYSNGQQVLTSACGSPSFVSKIIAGTDISVNTESGIVTVSDISTLQSVTGRGSSSTYEISINNYTGSTDTNTGALVVRGGVGIGENLNVFGAITGSNLQIYGLPGSTSTINGILSVPTLKITGGVNSFCTATGSVQIDGGMAVQGNIFSTGNVYANGYLVNTGTFSGGTLSAKTTITSTETSTSTNTGALQVVGGVGIGLDVFVGGFVNADHFQAYGQNTSTFAGPVQFNNTVTVTVTTDSESTESGAVLVTGGVGIGGNLNVGGTVTAPEFNGYFSGTISATGTVTTASCATNIIGGQAGAILYQTDTGLTGFVTTASEGQILVSGGAGTPVYQNTLTLTGLTVSDSTDTGALVVVGGVGIGANLNVGGHISGESLNLSSISAESTITGTLNVGIANVTFPLAAHSTDSGAFTVVGGVGVGGDVYIGGTLFVDRALAITTSTICSAAVTSIVAGTDTAVSTSTGAVVIWNTSTLQTVTDRGNSTTNIISIVNTEISTSTTTGALVVGGGVGVGGDVYVGGNLNVTGAIVGGALVVTTASIASQAATSITAGTDTAVSTSTGAITIWNTSTLQTVTDRGNSTTNIIVITNATASTSTDTGALQVAGGAGIGGTLNVGQGIKVQGSSEIIGGNGLGYTLRVRGGTGAQYAFGTGQCGINTDALNSTGTAYKSYYFGASDFRFNIYSGEEPGGMVQSQALAISTAGFVSISSLENAVSTQSGSLQVAGGVGIGGNLYVGGEIYAQKLTIEYTTVTTTIIETDDIIRTSNITEASNTQSGALQISGGAGIGGTVWIGGNLNVNGTAYLNNAQVLTTSSGLSSILGTSIINQKLLIAAGETSTSTSSGALVVEGGIGIGKDIYVGGIITSINTTNSTSTDTGALILAGGVGVAQDMYVGGTIYSAGSQVLTFANTASLVSSSAGYSSTSGYALSFNTGTLVNIAVSATTSTFATTSGYALNFNTGTLVNISVFASSSTYANVAGVADSLGTGTYSISNTTNSTSTDSGALTVVGGVGIGGTVNVGERIFINGAEVLTTSSVNQFANQTAIYAGTDTAVSSNSGTSITIWNTSTLQTVSDRGNSTTNAILITNATDSAGTDSGALQVVGGGGIGGNLYVGGDLYQRGAKVVTTSTVQSLSTSTLAGVTQYGATTPDAIRITNTSSSTSVITGALVVDGGVGIGGTLNVANTSYIHGSKILTAEDLQTVTHTATYITNDPGSVSGLTTIANTTTVYGTYDFGSVSDTWVFNDYNTGTNVGYYSIHDASTAPAFIVYIGFDGITDFNRIVLNINYTQNSGHTQTIDLYNYVQNSWDTFTTYSGSPGWFEFILGTIDPAPYISSGKVTARIDHISFGNTSHRTWIDYIALEKSIQGGQGPRGATGATGPQGSQGATTSTTSTFVFFNTLSSTSTVESNSVYIVGGLGIGKSLLVTGEAVFQNNVTFAGTSTFVYSTNTYYTDNLINVHVPQGSSGTNHTWTVDDGKDVGFIYHYYKGQDKDAFLGLANDSGYLEWYANGNELGGIFTGTEYGIFKTGGIILKHTTASNSTETGALIVAGGVGIGQDLYVGGALYQQGQQVLTTASVNQYANQTSITAGTDTAVSTSTGAITIWNNSTLQSVTGRGNSTTNTVVITNTTAASSTNSGALQVVGGAGFGGNVYIGGNVSVVGTINASITGIITTATNLAGGLSGQLLYQTTSGVTSFVNTGAIGTVLVSQGSDSPQYQNTLRLDGITASTSTNSGALVVAGGVGIGGNLTVGEQVITSAITATTDLVIGTTGAVEIRNNGYLTKFASNGYIEVGGNIVGGPYGANQLDLGASASLSAVRSIGGPNGGVLIRTGTDTSITNTWQFGYDGNLTAPGNIIVQSTASSTSTATGALTVAGGLGVGGQINATSIVAGGVRSTTSSSAPVNPTVGDIWYNTNNNRMYRYTANGVVNFWLDYTGPVVQYLTSF